MHSICCDQSDNPLHYRRKLRQPAHRRVRPAVRMQWWASTTAVPAWREAPKEGRPPPPRHHPLRHPRPRRILRRLVARLRCVRYKRLCRNRGKEPSDCIIDCIICFPPQTARHAPSTAGPSSSSSSSSSSSLSPPPGAAYRLGSYSSSSAGLGTGWLLLRHNCWSRRRKLMRGSPRVRHERAPSSSSSSSSPRSLGACRRAAIGGSDAREGDVGHSCG